MLIKTFLKDVITAVENDSQNYQNTHLVECHFLKAIKELFDDTTTKSLLKMTSMTILVEGFYRALSTTSLKDSLLAVRVKRWDNHYGTPTINFLLTYAKQIDCVTDMFRNFQTLDFPNVTPWKVIEDHHFILDSKNDVMIDVDSTTQIEIPPKEVTGQFIKTNNPSGGFTTTPCDPVSLKFIEYAGMVAAESGTVLEIGAAFGAASLQALAKGANVFCNDIAPNNLAVVKNRYELLNGTKDKGCKSLTGDQSKLIFVPGEFPHELTGLPKNYFDAILICRVLHFFDGEKIEKSLRQLADNLKQGGKLFIVCETPYLKNWNKFIPEFDKRVSEGVEWPGEITNPADFEDSGRAAALPKFVHWITKEVLKKSLLKTKLGVEHLSYIDRRGQFPEDLLLDGRESIGAVAVKPY